MDLESVNVFLVALLEGLNSVEAKYKSLQQATKPIFNDEDDLTLWKTLDVTRNIIQTQIKTPQLVSQKSSRSMLFKWLNVCFIYSF